ncbi:MAG: TonB-dependent receptor [Deltaproteobacteria bacterium]|jgi:vitamin B12 transporter|nr:TonB-dependent receptor [Deltaproteobacteria bacterium]
MFASGIRFLALAALPALIVLSIPSRSAAQEGEEPGTGEGLGAVVVSASRTAEALREVSSNVTVITGEQVERSAANDLSDVLIQQGFWLSDNGSSKTVQIRGMNSDVLDFTQIQSRVLILVNGRRTGAVHVDQIPVENVERIEIVRGPSAVQYGTSALGGVINVITKKGESDSFTAALEVGFGSYGLNRESFSFTGGRGPFDFAGSFSYEERDSITTLYGTKYNRTSSEKKNVSLEAGYTFNGLHRIGISYAHTRNNNEWPSVGLRDYLGDPSIERDLGRNYGNYILSIETAGITYDGATEEGTFDWSAFFSKSTSEHFSFTRNDYTGYGDNASETFQHVTNVGASVGYNGDLLDFRLGFDYIEYKIKGTYNGDNVADDLGIYASAKIKPMGETLFVSLGGRYDKFGFENFLPEGGSKSKSHFSPSVGVSYLPKEWLKLRANYSEGMRMPAAYEYMGEMSAAFPYHPNPDLQPEESKTWEAGLDVDYRFLSGSFTYFHTDWENRITQGSHPSGNGNWYFNLKESEISGLEAALSADLGEAFELGFRLRPYVNFTYLTKRKNKDPEQVAKASNDSTLPYVPRWTLSYGVSFNHPGIDLEANVNAVHMGDILYHNEFIGYHFTKGSEFVALDLAVEKGLFEIGPEGKYGKLKLRVEAKNLLGSKNETYMDYPGPGRNFYVGLKWVY